MKTDPTTRQVKVDISQTTPVVCESCGNDLFNASFRIRKISALLSPHGKETLVPMQLFVCSKCDHINKEFLPELDTKDDTV